MAKFYVESGEFQALVVAQGPIAAAAKALRLATSDDQLAPTVNVNQRGFLKNRDNPSSGQDDMTLETGTLFGLILEHELC